MSAHPILNCNRSDAMAALPMAFEELFALYIGKTCSTASAKTMAIKPASTASSGAVQDNEHLIELPKS